MLRSIDGLEEVEIIRPGYAIEYDFVDPTELKPFPRNQKDPWPFSMRGQINGTSGYEEAAAQGLSSGVSTPASISWETGTFHPETLGCLYPRAVLIR